MKRGKRNVPKMTPMYRDPLDVALDEDTYDIEGVDMTEQRALFEPRHLQLPSHRGFPPTRYQGSKLKLLDWIWQELGGIAFDSAIDLFGGTGTVSFLFKTKGKRVIFNDILKSNCVAAEALIANSGTLLTEAQLRSLFIPKAGKHYDDFIARTFEGVFYTSEENQLLDVVVQNIADLEGRERSLAFFALFQACLAKRPYNLFHRANLYMRLAEVDRSFGNKTTWERPLLDHMLMATEQANSAIFDNGREHTIISHDAEEVTARADLLYLDPPYINGRGVGTDYLDYYHFLEGLVLYRDWASHVDLGRKHRRFRHRPNSWLDAGGFLRALARVVDRHRQSVIVISYRADGLPTPDELQGVLTRAGKRVRLASSRSYQYALAKTATKELLIIGE